jgi:hypothetical protein
MSISREEIFRMLDKEDDYAQGWNRDAQGNDVGNDGRHSYMDWIVFAEKYIDEAKLTYSNYTPDARAVRIRILKAANLLINALVNHGQSSDLEDIAGVSSTKYPILYGGLKTFQQLRDTNS